MHCVYYYFSSAVPTVFDVHNPPPSIACIRQVQLRSSPPAKRLALDKATVTCSNISVNLLCIFHHAVLVYYFLSMGCGLKIKLYFYIIVSF